VTCGGRETTESHKYKSVPVINKAISPESQPANRASKSEKLLLNLPTIRQISAEQLPSSQRAYIERLSSSQRADILRYMEIQHLKGDSELQFLQCSGLALLKRHVNSSGILNVPKHYQVCKKMSFREHGHAVALISFPGSGNSWVRQLLETTTGVYTGSVYCDGAYIEAGMIGEGVRSENVIAVKSHRCNDACNSDFSKVIYIVRNPLDTIFAEFNRKMTLHSLHSPTSHVDELSEAQFSKHNQLTTMVMIHARVHS